MASALTNSQEGMGTGQVWGCWGANTALHQSERMTAANSQLIWLPTTRLMLAEGVSVIKGKNNLTVVPHLAQICQCSVQYNSEHWV